MEKKDSGKENRTLIMVAVAKMKPVHGKPRGARNEGRMKHKK